MKETKKEIDWSGIKFKIMKEFGECIDIIFVKEKFNNQAREIFLKPHDQADGLSAVTQLLELDNKISINNLPIAKIHNKPSRIKRMILAFKHLKRQAPFNYQYKIERKEITGTSPGISFFYFNNEQTSTLKELCLKRNINLNSLVVWALDKAASTVFVEKESKRVWMIPVNIRDSYDDKFKTGNHATALSIFAQGLQKPEEIHQQIREQMKSGIIWGGKIIANAPKLIGEKRLRKIGKNAKSPYLGLCSNLGEQPFEGVDILNKEDYQWLVFPPSIKYCPISVCIMTWDGRIGISCQLHPSMISALDDTHDFLSLIYQEMINEIGFKETTQTQIKSIAWSEVEENGIKY